MYIENFFTKKGENVLTWEVGKIVIVGLTSGLANQMYEYAAAYALSQEIKQELVLDITECVNSGGGGYYLDLFSIPDCPKMMYFIQDSEGGGHADVRRIPEHLREKVIVLTEEIRKNTIQYKSLRDFTKRKCRGDIYLCGYFFERGKYYDKYWDKLKTFFCLKSKIREVEIFQKLICDKISVGIHIRRGDILLAEWAEKMEDAYYRASIEYCRKYLSKDGKKCSFFIFSDDIEYAKKILGKDSSLWYVNFGGSREASVAEFVCLSLCNHRILSNSSTFSWLTSELNTYKKKKTFYQGKRAQLTWRDHIKRSLRLTLMICGKSRQSIRLDGKEIKKYSSYYQTDDLDNIRDYQKRKIALLNVDVTENNYESILNEIGTLSMNAFERTTEEGNRFLYQKFNALVEAKRYDNALALEGRIYEDYSEDGLFRKNLVKALTGIGAYKEAAMEGDRRTERKHFLIIPAGKSYASGCRCGLVELGIALHHFGHNVSFILDPLEESERYYIISNELLIDRRGNCFGCHQYLQEEVEKEGFDRFLDHFQENELFIITRKRKFCVQFERVRGKKITYIFPDFTDRRDAESRVGDRMPKEDIEYLYKNADIIMTQDADNLRDNCKYILWKDHDHREEYWLEKRRWQLGDLDRFGERVISMAKALHERLQ